MKKIPLLISIFIGMIYGSIRYDWVIGIFYGILIVYPIVLTMINIYYLFHPKLFLESRVNDLIIIFLGSIYGCCYSLIDNITFYDYTTTLYNSEIHTPIYTQALLTVIVLLVIGYIGYFVLTYIPLSKMSPIIIVLSISFMYIGVYENILWIIQFFNKNGWLYCILPINYIIMVIKTMHYKVNEWKNIDSNKTHDNPLLNTLYQLLLKSTLWPIIGFVLSWFVLGIILMILTLFGQQPDYFIQAYFNTSEWNLSQKISPDNIYYDEHYLCTVAARGHQKVVKPKRIGYRHGRMVIVNRQLCIANAFEQILEERLPIIHKYIRKFYDYFGFNFAAKINNPYYQDIIYVCMKPLEWIFLFVIYLHDIHPEDRIAMQYTK